MKILLLLFALNSYAKFDLGGDCATQIKYDSAKHVKRLKEYRAALKKKNWKQAIKYQKAEVRRACHNSFGWFELAKYYLADNNKPAAIEIMEEVYSRGLQITPVTLLHHKTVEAFTKEASFQKSKIGKTILQHKKKALLRRKKFRRQLDTLPSTKKPPTHYVNKNACPFECCTFRQWNVLKHIKIFKSTKGLQLVSYLNGGDKVTGLTGEAHLEPLPIGVAHDHGQFKKGEIIWLLDNIGEGQRNYWRHGKVSSGPMHQTYNIDYCLRPTQKCWAEAIFEKDAASNGNLFRSSAKTSPRLYEWWVKVKTDKGKIGWTKETEAFTNMDACGS